MKKLIMLVVGVACAIAANAASCSWGVTDIKTRGTMESAAASADTVYLIIIEGEIGSPHDITRGDIISVLGSETMSDLEKTEWIEDRSVGKSPLTEAGKVVGAFLGREDLSEGSNKFLGLIVEGSEIKADAYYCLTAEKEYDWDGESDLAVALGSQATLTSTASNWSQVSGVPEPTSGVLLILGIAALALRRRIKNG